MKIHSLLPAPCSLAFILAFLIATATAGPVSHFGALKACKIGGRGYLCGSKNGVENTAIQVKGPSLFWSSGAGAPFYQATTVNWFVDNMEIGVIRAAMAIRYYREGREEVGDGYFNPSSRAEQKARIKNVIDAAIFNDIYVIVDWHSHDAHTASEANLARDFFVEIANEYRDVPNIIWEVYNEPVSASTAQINTYSNAIITALRNAGNENLVLIGSPRWSSQPQQQASSWGTSDFAVQRNVAFTFHFYSAEGGGSGHNSIRTNAQSAMNAGYAIFGSEWGFSEASGNGNVNNASAWRTWMDTDKISNCNWSVSALNESSSMFTVGTGINDLSAERLTASGRHFRDYMAENKWTAQIPSNHPRGNDYQASVRDGDSVVITAAQLGLTGTITDISQPEFGTASYTSNSITYTTPQNNSPERVLFTYKITQGSITVQRKVTVTITNRRPILPERNPIAVSRRAPTALNLTNQFAPVDPSRLAMSFSGATLADPSVGTIEVIGANRDSLLFTPSSSQHNVELKEVTLNYTIQNTAGAASSASVILQLQNLAPIINRLLNFDCCLYSQPNTGPIGIGIRQVGGRDPDGDSLWFKELYLDPQYPGSLQQVRADSFVYHPENNRTGRVVFLAVITDGSLESIVGRSALVLTGSGSSIGDLPIPTDIPGHTYIASQLSVGNFGIKTRGSGNIAVYFAQSGFAELDIYSLSGKNMGTLLSGYQNAGSSEISLKNLPKGVYILRLRQGSQIKTMRIVK
ncbi:MAG: cellulase family glycosylhydrolase [Fibromonadaceae bacterium]|jgi:hypothetical protein|nr:cellulase family glycosylhydrolase [Fibromonadaceae bacterium]